MITRVKNSDDAILAFNENLEGLLTGKRKPMVVKEVNNTLGKLTNVVKMELMHKAITGDKERMEWFDKPQKQLIK